MKIVGTRKPAEGWKAFDALQRLVMALRKGHGVFPKGVYKFRTFEEAQAWSLEQMLKSPESRR